jgi:RNA polymerase sigma-70 factor (ECF subfamily)
VDRHAFEKIFDLYSLAIYHYGFRLCRDPLLADAIVGDVFAKLFENLVTCPEPIPDLRTFLYKIAHPLVVERSHQCLHWTGCRVVEAIPANGTVSLNARDRVLYQATVRMILNDLTEDQRHVIILRFLEGFSIKETAWITGKTVGNVKVIQFRALAALRENLDPQVEMDRIFTLLRLLWV